MEFEFDRGFFGIFANLASTTKEVKTLHIRVRILSFKIRVNYM